MSEIRVYESHKNDDSIIDFINSKCLDYKGYDPIELAVDIMNDELINMHGPEHHYIVPAVMLTCIHNFKKEKDSLSDILKTAYNRTIEETSRVCSFKQGSCGAAQGTGVFLSIFLGRDKLDEDAWSPSNDIIAESLKVIDESHGPRCCKRDTYISLETAAKFLEDKFALRLPVSEGKCTFSLRNDHCGHEDCEYYNLSNSLV